MKEGSRRGSAPYFFVHLFDAVCHIPPAFSQSAFVVYFDMSPDGLAAGDEVDELPDVLGVEAPLPDVLPEPLPDVPDGVLELPEGAFVPPPVLDCAAAIAGARATTATRRPRTIFRIMTSSNLRLTMLPPGGAAMFRPPSKSYIRGEVRRCRCRGGPVTEGKFAEFLSPGSLRGRQQRHTNAIQEVCLTAGGRRDDLTAIGT